MVRAERGLRNNTRRLSHQPAYLVNHKALDLTSIVSKASESLESLS